jgi:sigma-54 dependent transcriptional regulator of gfr operon
MSLLSPRAAGARCAFVSFNCAQYASNPELLAANLFGYVKGAFTGAQSDKAGAFEAANGGVLFLDEVHRLDAQGQEKLFTWLDRKEIYRVGTAQGMPISLRLVFATTEDIHSTFLTTFIRRIPILVSLPDLQPAAATRKKR